MSGQLGDFTEHEIQVMLLRDTHGIHAPRHHRTLLKWQKMIQFRGLCKCCRADPVVVSVVNEKRRDRKVLCQDCYLTALDLVHDALAQRKEA